MRIDRKTCADEVDNANWAHNAIFLMKLFCLIRCNGIKEGLFKTCVVADAVIQQNGICKDKVKKYSSKNNKHFCKIGQYSKHFLININIASKGQKAYLKNGLADGICIQSWSK